MQTEIKIKTPDQEQIERSAPYTDKELFSIWKAGTYEELRAATGIAPATVIKHRKEDRPIYHDPETGEFFTVKLTKIGKES